MEKLGKALIFIAVLIIYVITEKIFGSYLSLIIPILLIVFSYWITNKYVDKNKKPLFLSYSLMIGHVLWYFVGLGALFYFRNQSEAVNSVYKSIEFSSLIDIGILLALYLWLILRPGLVSGIATLIFILVEIIWASIYISNAENKFLLKSQFMHLTLFAITFIALVRGLNMYRKNKSQIKKENQLTTSSNISS